MLVQEIETLRGQMHEIAAHEEALLRSLAESLHEAEQRLLQHVRDIATQHGERRVQLLDELRALASDMGSFPAASPQAGLDLDFDVAQPRVAFQGALELPGLGGGSWRDATRMISEDDGLEHLLRANAR